ncbi:MAG: AbrB/MazE/SpoVT family DNA-binding domain-containing protein [Dethiobacter sp.]|jgi:AbrB family looped-hinge helix DNA binding protein|nr:MAG: AbrB/MazE/SpoVT family DNA-binding domain-containing protein [Dethiobacter sp.]
MKTRISSKGQITLPSEVRRKLNLLTGDELYVKAAGENSILLEVKKNKTNAQNKTTEAINASAGLWKNRKDFNDHTIREMRNADSKRLENLIHE